MQVTARSYIAAGVVPAVAGLIAAAPIAVHPPELSVASLAPRLTASAANIIPNLFNDIINIPANELIALGDGTVTLGNNNQFSFTPTEANGGFRNISLDQTGVVGLTSHFTYAGNWWIVHPTNVLGTDAGDIARYQALVNVLVPIPGLSVPLGNMVAAILASQLPMNIGCTETNAGGCNEPFAILGDMFHLERIVAMFSPQGYTFPVVRDPVTCDSEGNCNRADPNGELMPWSGQTVRISLDPFAPVTPGVINPAASFVNSLMQEPTGLTPLPNPVTTFANLGTSIFNTFNPFVIGTQCGFCAPFVPGSGVTFAQAIQNSIESFLSLIPGYQGPVPSAATTAPETALTASSQPDPATRKALFASTPVAGSSVDGTTDTQTAVAPTTRAQQNRQGLKTAMSEVSQDLSPTTTTATEGSAEPTSTTAQDPAANAPVRKRQSSTASKADVADGSATAKQPGTAKSVADHVKAAVAKATESKASSSKASDSKAGDSSK